MASSPSTSYTKVPEDTNVGRVATVWGVGVGSIAVKEAECNVCEGVEKLFYQWTQTFEWEEDPAVVVDARAPAAVRRNQYPGHSRGGWTGAYDGENRAYVRFGRLVRVPCPVQVPRRPPSGYNIIHLIRITPPTRLRIFALKTPQRAP